MEKYDYRRKETSDRFQSCKKMLRKEFYAFLKFAREHFPEQMEGRNGCYVCIPLQTIEGEFNYTFELGIVPKEKKEKYSFLSQEKNKRLSGRTNTSITTSFQTRNPEYIFSMKGGRKEKWGKWGGAVCFDCYKVVSCSGFSEVMDECFASWLVFRLVYAYAINIESMEFIFRDRVPLPLEIKKTLDYLKYLEEQEQNIFQTKN
jgi:hypothetical protein